MIEYHVEIPQLPQLQEAFAKAPNLVAQAVINAGNASLLNYQANIKGFAPVRTGRYRSSTVIHPMKRQGAVIEGSVGPTVNYSDAVEEGTGIYGPKKRPITPKRGKVLAFKVNGKMVFAKSVKGFPGRFPVKRSLEANQSKTEAHFQKAIDQVTNEIVRQIG